MKKLIIRQARALAATLEFYKYKAGLCPDSWAWEDIGVEQKADLYNIAAIYHGTDCEDMSNDNAGFLLFIECVEKVELHTDSLKWSLETEADNNWKYSIYKALYNTLLRTFSCLAHSSNPDFAELYNVVSDDEKGLGVQLKKEQEITQVTVKDFEK